MELLEEMMENLKQLNKEFDNFGKDYDFSDLFIEEINQEPIIVCGISFMASDILKEVQPTTFDTLLSDFQDGYDLYSIEEYRELEDEIEDLEYSIYKLEEQLNEEV